MIEKEKETDLAIEEVKPLSLFENRMKSLLDELDEHMAQIGGDYGPVLMEVLQNRLELIIKNFDDEIHKLVADSFKKWKAIDNHLREFVKSDIIAPNKNKLREKMKDSSVPEFIKDVDFGPVGSK